MSNKSQGNALEAAIETINRIYMARGSARVVKTPDPVMITGRKGATITGRLMVADMTDFSGVLYGGRAVVFDAKSTTQKRFNLAELKKPRGGGFSQLDILCSSAQIGAIAFILIAEVGGPCYLVRVDGEGFTQDASGARVQLRDKSSLKLAEYTPFRGYDWLGELRRQLNANDAAAAAAQVSGQAPRELYTGPRAVGSDSKG